MTEQQSEHIPHPSSVPAQPPILNYAGGSELEQLHAEYVEAKAAESAAKARAGAVVNRLKVALTQAFPDAQHMRLAGPGGPTLTLDAVTSWKFNSVKLKAADPELYVRYAYQQTAWVLKTVKGG